jgi:hypothetical protein
MYDTRQKKFWELALDSWPNGHESQPPLNHSVEWVHLVNKTCVLKTSW